LPGDCKERRTEAIGEKSQVDAAKIPSGAEYGSPEGEDQLTKTGNSRIRNKHTETTLRLGKEGRKKKVGGKTNSPQISRREGRNLPKHQLKG